MPCWKNVANTWSAVMWIGIYTKRIYWWSLWRPLEWLLLKLAICQARSAHKRVLVKWHRERHFELPPGSLQPLYWQSEWFAEDRKFLFENQHQPDRLVHVSTDMSNMCRDKICTEPERIGYSVDERVRSRLTLASASEIRAKFTGRCNSIDTKCCESSQLPAPSMCDMWDHHCCYSLHTYNKSFQWEIESNQLSSPFKLAPVLRNICICFSHFHRTKRPLMQYCTHSACLAVSLSVWYQNWREKTAET